MRKFTLFFLLLGIVVLYTGCPKNVPKEPAVMEKIVQYEANRLMNDANRYYCAKGEQPYEVAGVGEQRTYFDCKGIEAGEERARRYRDEIIYRLIRNIDSAYFQFESDLYSRRTSSSFLADVTDISLGLATTITGGERAKTVLGAVITAFRGGRKAGSINFYREQTAELIITKMQTSRNRILADMLRQIQEKGTDDYPLDAALDDTVRYFYAGTLHRAFQELQQDTSVQANQAKEEVRVLKGFKPDTPATIDQTNPAVEARETLEALFAQSKKTGSASTDALAKLQKIHEKIVNDVALTEAMNADAQLKPLLADLKKFVETEKNPVKSAETLESIIFFGRTKLSRENLMKIFRFINESKNN